MNQDKMYLILSFTLYIALFLEKFIPLAKILHCRRQWRHGKISPLVIKMRGVSAQLLQSQFKMLDLFVTRWHFPSGYGLHKWRILENCRSLALNKIWTQGFLHWWPAVCESTLIKFVLLFLLLCPHRSTTRCAQSMQWCLLLAKWLWVNFYGIDCFWWRDHFKGGHGDTWINWDCSNSYWCCCCFDLH